MVLAVGPKLNDYKSQHQSSEPKAPRYSHHMLTKPDETPLVVAPYLEVVRPSVTSELHDYSHLALVNKGVTTILQAPTFAGSQISIATGT